MVSEENKGIFGPDCDLSCKPVDKKPITQFFAFLETTASLLKSLATRYIRISDNAWSGFLMILFVLVLWLSGDIQKFVFIAIISVLSVLVFIDIFIDNWGKIFRAFRREKTFSEMDKSTSLSIIHTLSRFNVVGNDLLDLLKFLKGKKWLSVRMLDTILTQQHLDEYAVNEFLSIDLNKKDLLRVLEEYPNSVNEETLGVILKKWDYSEDVVKACLQYQITSIELIRKQKEISRKEFRLIEEICPFRNINKHWIMKPLQILFLIFGLITSFLLFSFQQNESLKAVASHSSDSIFSLFLTNLVLALFVSVVLWALLYALALPIIKFVYIKYKEWQFEPAYKKVFKT
ncbi:MAG: hypothetical protein ABIA76_00785 [Candidatus Diapherotrites archaeon]